MVVVFALAAGLAYALASFLQHRVASAQPPEHALRLRLLVELVKRPLWLLGIVLDIGAYLFEALALSIGSIVVVQPLLVSGLLFSLPLSALGTERKVGVREVVAAIALTMGLAVFLVVGSPGGGTAQAALAEWLVLFAVVAVLVVALVAGSRRAAAHHRAMALAAGAGCTYALTAALTKSVTDLIGVDGVGGTLAAWQPYALGVVSVVGLVLNQSAFQAGHLAASLPVLAVTNPVVSSVAGITLFGERFGATGASEISVTAAAVAVMTLGTIALARSPLVTGASRVTGSGEAALSPGVAHR